jgi:hypothetical protein
MSEVTGNLIVKNETKEYGSNGFKKREFVIKTNDSQYPQEIQIELVQDKCKLIDSFNIGEELKVSYNLNGRSWVNPQGESKYFNSIQGWKIERLDVNKDGLEHAKTVIDNVFEPVGDLNEEQDDLPF